MVLFTPDFAPCWLACAVQRSFQRLVYFVPEPKSHRTMNNFWALMERNRFALVHWHTLRQAWCFDLAHVTISVIFCGRWKMWCCHGSCFPTTRRLELSHSERISTLVLCRIVCRVLPRLGKPFSLPPNNSRNTLCFLSSGKGALVCSPGLHLTLAACESTHLQLAHLGCHTSSLLQVFLPQRLCWQRTDWIFSFSPSQECGGSESGRDRWLWRGGG